MFSVNLLETNVVPCIHVQSNLGYPATLGPAHIYGKWMLQQNQIIFNSLVKIDQNIFVCLRIDFRITGIWSFERAWEKKKLKFIWHCESEGSCLVS